VEEMQYAAARLGSWVAGNMLVSADFFSNWRTKSLDKGALIATTKAGLGERDVAPTLQFCLVVL
jgi:hypothetical protein